MLEPTAEQYRRIRRASIMLVVGSGGETRAIPASARWGEKPPEV